MSTFEIYLDSNSANIKKNNETGDCYFHLPSIETDILQDDVFIALTGGSIPYSWYNVNIYNNKIVLLVGSSLTELFIPIANYNVNSLRNEIQNLLDSHMITIDYDNNLKRLWWHDLKEPRVDTLVPVGFI